MQTRKNSLLLFSKLPEAGLVKTRLSVLKVGMLTPEDAADLYECMLFDVVEICLGAFKELEAGARDHENGFEDTYELVISCAPKENLTKMKELIEGAFDSAVFDTDLPITFITDEGRSFDEHYNHAFEQVWGMGADCILSMGADMPALTTFDVVNGFEKLQTFMSHTGADSSGIVLSPDQEMGVSIIGWTRETNFDHTDIFYNKEGLVVLSAYIEKAAKLGIPAIYIPPVPDVDTMADLMHNITLIQALKYCEPPAGHPYAWRTAEKLAELGLDEVRVPPNALFDPRDTIDA